MNMIPDPYIVSGVRLIVIGITEDEIAIAAIRYKSFLSGFNRVLVFDYDTIEVSAKGRKTASETNRMASLSEISRLKSHLENLNKSRRVA